MHIYYVYRSFGVCFCFCFFKNDNKRQCTSIRNVRWERATTHAYNMSFWNRNPSPFTIFKLSSASPVHMKLVCKWNRSGINREHFNDRQKCSVSNVLHVNRHLWPLKRCLKIGSLLILEIRIRKLIYREFILQFMLLSQPVAKHLIRDYQVCQCEWTQIFSKRTARNNTLPLVFYASRPLRKPCTK